MHERASVRRLLVALVFVWLALDPTRAIAQPSLSVPARVRLVRTECVAPSQALRALMEQLRIELRAIGTELVDGADAEARLTLDLGCAAAPERALVVLTDLASGRSVEETVELSDQAVARVRSLAVALSELVRSRWGELHDGRAPAAPDLGSRIQAEVETAVEARLARGVREVLEVSLDARIAHEVRRALAARRRPAAPPPPMPSGFLEVSLGASGAPSAGSALGELRVGGTVALGGPVRMDFGVLGGAGNAIDPLGDVLLATVAADVRISLAHLAPDWMIDVGPRLVAGWARAQGLPFDAAVRGLAEDAVRGELGASLRVRARATPGLWLAGGVYVGAGLLGIDAREGARRVAAQLGPLLAADVGLAWSL